jgi:hypothetical protein
MAAFGRDAPKPATAQTLPKVVLLGDSVREGYAPFVAELLTGFEDREAYKLSPKAILRIEGTGRR